MYKSILFTRQGNVKTAPMFVHVEKRKVHACTTCMICTLITTCEEEWMLFDESRSIYRVIDINKPRKVNGNVLRGVEAGTSFFKLFYFFTHLYTPLFNLLPWYLTLSCKSFDPANYSNVLLIIMTHYGQRHIPEDIEKQDNLHWEKWILKINIWILNLMSRYSS